jgi:hypothetical protein
MRGTYGSLETPCIIFTTPGPHGSVWYAVEGSVNVNLTYDPMEDGVNVELLTDVDMFTAGQPIKNDEHLKYWVYR